MNKEKLKRQMKKAAADIAEGAVLTIFVVGMFIGALAVNTAGRSERITEPNTRGKALAGVCESLNKSFDITLH